MTERPKKSARKAEPASKRPSGRGAESANAMGVDGSTSSDLTPTVGRNLKRFRAERGLSLEALAKVSGVSRAMLGQVELGQSTPTINVVWKIARALDVPFSALISEQGAAGTWVLPSTKARLLTSADGAFTSRALFPFDRPRTVEFYELRLAPSGREIAEPHPPGTTENLVVARGRVAISIDGDRRLLEAGDAIFFEAHVPHVYENVDSREEAAMYLVMTYAQKV
jgi:transcriptional regulator with XRE-family HTH domain